MDLGSERSILATWPLAVVGREGERRVEVLPPANEEEIRSKVGTTAQESLHEAKVTESPNDAHAQDSQELEPPRTQTAQHATEREASCRASDATGGRLVTQPDGMAGVRAQLQRRCPRWARTVCRSQPHGIR